MLLSEFFTYCQWLFYLLLELLVVRFVVNRIDINPQKILQTRDRFYHWSISCLG
ncbi:hypothetical protein [Fulvivirga sedimenti]|uniref:Uncharacterized protein n=1 Tax=Fulvivirga sedimenti TaxID=2879465 RepID=A0A9X1KZ32_9BACT|nr:hypothetical protein [Fulvivirga sedimenti]MCA6075462.1 hypothetical protein [Fulvivirga sedimenti]MCA6076639.1 hypothetical protein [Fulvivirga sedimenti]MCA6077767.1 hypothetical protein [Fulvivirga sedimenti]